MDVIIWAVIFVAVFVAVMVWIVKGNRKKVARYRDWATANGWTYTEKDDSRAGRWQVPPFDLGQRQTVTNVLEGTVAEHSVAAFEHRVVSKRGGKARTYTQTVLTVALPSALPSVLIASQRTPERIMFMGEVGKDYEVEWAEFNREWFIRTDDIRFTSDFIHPQLMERLMKPDAIGLSIRVEGSDLIGWYTGARDELVMIEKQLPVLLDVARLIPGFVWKDYGRA